MGDISRSFTGQDSQLPTFFLYTANVAVGNNKSMVSLYNGQSGSILCIREIRIVNTTITAATGVVAEFELRRITGHSGGTALTHESADTQDTLSANITGKSGATVTGESANKFMDWHKSTDDWGSGTLDTESMDACMQNIPSYRSMPEEKPITLRNGEGVTIKCATNTTAGVFDIMIKYTVE